jgi:hypothetical protein
MKNTIYFSFVGSFKGYETEITDALLEQMGDRFYHQELQDSYYEYYHHKAHKDYMIVIDRWWDNRYRHWNERSFVTSKKLVGGPCHPNLDMCHEFLRRV